jgi:hypothetical protein
MGGEKNMEILVIAVATGAIAAGICPICPKFF